MDPRRTCPPVRLTDDSSAPAPGPEKCRRELSPQRIRGRTLVAETVAELVRAGLRRGVHYVQRWGRALDLSETAIRQRCDPTHVDHAAWTSGDLEAIGERYPEDLEEIVAALASDREARRLGEVPRDPHALALAAGARSGDLSRAVLTAMADGHCSPAEWADIERSFADLEREARRGRAAARRAAKGGAR